MTDSFSDKHEVYRSSAYVDFLEPKGATNWSADIRPNAKGILLLATFEIYFDLAIAGKESYNVQEASIKAIGLMLADAIGVRGGTNG